MKYKKRPKLNILRYAFICSKKKANVEDFVSS